MRDCSDGCGKVVASYVQECFPVAPWDTQGLPQRTLAERCAQHHGLCAYRSDDPKRCRHCHNLTGTNELCPSCLPVVTREAKRKATLAAKAAGVEPQS